jgi:hypothetical protein
VTATEFESLCHQLLTHHSELALVFLNAVVRIFSLDTHGQINDMRLALTRKCVLVDGERGPSDAVHRLSVEQLLARAFSRKISRSNARIDIQLLDEFDFLQKFQMVFNLLPLMLRLLTGVSVRNGWKILQVVCAFGRHQALLLVVLRVLRRQSLLEKFAEVLPLLPEIIGL